MLYPTYPNWKENLEHELRCLGKLNRVNLSRVVFVPGFIKFSCIKFSFDIHMLCPGSACMWKTLNLVKVIFFPEFYNFSCHVFYFI